MFWVQKNSISLALLPLALALMPAAALAQHPWPVAVAGYHFGTSQTVGQQAEYFPANVLGMPADAATSTAPASAPTDVVSLGRGGWIVLEFDPVIEDRPGPDFTVFENAFFYGNGLVYDEWLTVEVSTDGTNWTAFPYDTVYGAGMAGRIPTAALPASRMDPMASGGDAFDLQDLGLTTARYVRLTDATRWQPADRLGAELDAVLALHQQGVMAVKAPSPHCTAALVGQQLQVQASTPLASLALADLQGRILADWPGGVGAGTAMLQLPAGLAAQPLLLCSRTATGATSRQLLWQP